MYKEENVHRMANDTIIKFIELYRSCECLWNESSQDYGSRLSRNAAYDTISRKMRIPGFGPREVARKIKNLRSAYEQEVKRIEDSEQNSNVEWVYRSDFVWFDLLDNFLRNSKKSKQTDRQSDNRTESSGKALPAAEGEKDTINSSKKVSTCGSSSSDIERSPRSRKRRSSMDDAYRTADEEQRNKRKTNAIEFEEYESFGKYIASSLSRMPFEYAVSAESEIHNVIVKYKVYAMRKIVYPRMKMTRMREGTRRHSTYLPPANFFPTLRQPTEETRPSSVDSVGHASD